MSYEEITTVEEAFKRHPLQTDLNRLRESLAWVDKSISVGGLMTMELQVICFVINNDDPNVPIWEPNFNDQERKYGTWRLGGDKSGAGFRFDGHVWTNAYTRAYGGARHALKDPGRVRHMIKYFPDHYKNLDLILQ